MKSVALIVTFGVLFISSARHQTLFSVASTAAPAKHVCVVGNVVKQGEITFDDGLSLTEAIRRAGGLLPHSKQISILEPDNGKWGGLQILYDVKTIQRKSFKDRVLPDGALIEVVSKKGNQTPVPPAGVCPWVPINLRGKA